MTAIALETDGTSTGAPELVDGEQMRMLYEAQSTALFRTVLGWTRGDRQAAEDLVQETMVRAWRNLPTLYGTSQALRPWLLTVARRILIDNVRARAVRPPEVEDDPLARMSAPGDPYEQVLDRQVISEALDTLSDSHRAVLTELYFRSRTVRQAAEVLGVPEGTVKSRTYHALRAMREVMGDVAA